MNRKTIFLGIAAGLLLLAIWNVSAARTAYAMSDGYALTVQDWLKIIAPALGSILSAALGIIPTQNPMQRAWLELLAQVLKRGAPVSVSVRVEYDDGTSSVFDFVLSQRTREQ